MTKLPSLVGFVIFAALAFWLVPAHSQEYRPLYSTVDVASGLTSANRNSLAFTNAASVAVTGAIGEFINVARLVCTAACYVAIRPTGAAGLVATAATGVYLPADEPEYFKVSSGERIAVIGASGSGNLIIHELTR